MANQSLRISAIVKTKRTEEGMSREALARRANVSTSMITRLERNAQLPGATNMFAIAAALGLDLNELAAAVDDADQVPAA